MQNMTFTANAGGDAECRTTQSGTEIVNVNIALSSGFGDNKRTTWSKLRILKKTMPEFMRNIKKGDRLLVSNAVYLVDDFDGKDGEKKQAHYFLAGFGSDIDVSAKAEYSAPSTPSQAPQQSTDDDDNLPF